MATSSTFRQAIKRCFLSPSGTHLAGAVAGASLFLTHKFATDASITSQSTQLEGINTFDDAAPLVAFHYDFPQPGSVEDVPQAVTDCFQSNCDYWMSEKRFAWMETLQRMSFDAIQATAEDSPEIGASHHSVLGMDLRNENSKSRAQFSSLAVHTVNDKIGNGNEFELNSQMGIPIENDLFVGNMLLLLRPVKAEDDPYYNQHDDGTRFEIRIQGRLKYIPKGELYCGGEITDHIHLNRVSKGLSNLLLGLLRRLIGSNMDYSFGEREGSKLLLLPHISFPLWTAMDYLVVTKSGDVPPDIIKESLQEYESEISVHVRKEGGGGGGGGDAKNDGGGGRRRGALNWNLDDTYSMSFSASCIDLPTWRIVNPWNVNLSNFWGNSLLRLVIYEKGDNIRNDDIRNDDDDDDDEIAANKYLLALQLEFLGVPSITLNNSAKEKGICEPARTSLLAI